MWGGKKSLRGYFQLGSKMKGHWYKDCVHKKSWVDVAVVVVVVEGRRGVMLMKGLCVRFVEVSMMLFSNKNVKKSYPEKEFLSVRTERFNGRVVYPFYVMSLRVDYFYSVSSSSAF
jgi:hypothetical protein